MPSSPPSKPIHQHRADNENIVLFEWPFLSLRIRAEFFAIFIGGKKNARPMFQTEGLPTGPRVTVEFAWHAASVFLAVVALIYLWAAITGKGDLMVRFTTAHCVILAVLGGFVAATGSIAPWQFPPTVLFVIISVFGTLAITT